MRICALALSLTIGVAAWAEEKKPEAPKTVEVEVKEETWNGILSPKVDGAPGNVVAVMKIKNGEKTETVNLIAEGETGETLKETAGRNVEASIVGKRSKDGIKVTKVIEKDVEAESKRMNDALRGGDAGETKDE